MATIYYFNAALGDNANNGTSELTPKRSITGAGGLNALFSAGTIVAGDTIKFNCGDVFRGGGAGGAIDPKACTGSAGNPITITSYGSGNKPVLNNATVITPAWTHIGGNVYTSTPGFTVLNLYEGATTTSPYGTALKLATSAANVASGGDGNWFLDSGLLTYRATDNANPTTHLIEIDVGANNTINIFDHVSANIYFVWEELTIAPALFEMTNANLIDNHHWTIQNCDFYYGRLLCQNAVNNLTIQNNTFNYGLYDSITLYDQNGSVPFVNLNVLNNKILNNNVILYEGNPTYWAADGANDTDCIGIQNMKDSNIIGNEMSGLCGSAGAGITYWCCSGQVTDPEGLKSFGYGVHTADNGGAGGRVRLWLWPLTYPDTYNHAIANLTAGVSRIAVDYLAGSGNINAATRGVWTCATVGANYVELDGNYTVITGDFSNADSGAMAWKEADIPLTGNVIARNFFHNIEGDAAIRCDSAAYVSDHSIQIVDNIIVNITEAAPYTGRVNQGTAIQFVRQQADSKSLIANNTIYNCEGHGLLGTSGGNYDIKNNIVDNITRFYVYTTNTTDTYDYNLYWNPGASLVFHDLANGDLAWSNWQSYHDQNGQSADPLLVNAGGSLDTDYKLQAGSPCINAGVDVGLTTDYGVNSIVGNPDIGAWEFGGVPGPTLTVHIGGPDTISIL